jgi:EAL domain-containing protein (putative c-di-GMP-specific phosphodiesterase class I)/GGDEF domain-containing protein
MKLGRLLFGGLTLIFILVLIGVETIHVHLTQRSLQLQLNAHANETATSLALSLGTLLKTPDEVLAQTIISPVFDRGYYRYIRFVNMEGKLIVGRSLSTDSHSTPEWFRRVFHVDEPAGQALVSSGWTQMGRVLVQVHPEFAYQQLWNTATGTLFWLAALFAIALYAAAQLLNGILRPLEAIESAASEIGERRFPEIAVTAQTRELASVVGAINALSAKMRDAMAHEEARASRLMREAYEDTGTGTLNERGFRQRVDLLLAKESEGEQTGIGHGAMIVLSLANLAEFNRAEGLAAGDVLLSAFGVALTKASAAAGGVVGHDRGASFVAFLPHVERAEAEAWTRSALTLADARTPGGAGIAWFEGAADFEELLVLARLAHTQARQSGESLRTLDMASGIAGTADEWRARIESACVEGRIELHGQEALSLPRRERLHVEVTSRLIGKAGVDMPAALFVPMASRYGMLPRLDAEVLTRMKPLLARNAARSEVYAVNVSGVSLRDKSYLDGVRALLSNPACEARRLIFEINAQGAAGDLAVSRQFATLVRGAGASLALDDLELSSSSLLLARQLLPAYVKLAPSATRNLATQSDARYLVESVVALLRPLEIAVLAKGVENQADIAVLQASGVSGIQGYAVSRPAPLQL